MGFTKDCTEFILYDFNSDSKTLVAVLIGFDESHCLNSI